MKWIIQKKEQAIAYIKSKYHDMKMFQKMLFFYIAILCVPTVLIGSLYLGAMEKQLVQEYRDSKEEILKQKKNSIQDSVSRILACVGSFQYNSSLIEYVDRYDFSTANGAYSWIRYVKPAFEQISFANAELTGIRIYRMRDKKINDPRYVLNGSDDPRIAQLGDMRYKELKLIMEEGDAVKECQVYMELFNTAGFSGVGYVEIDCSIDFLLAPLDFLKEGEALYLTHDNVSWQVKQDEEGSLYLSLYEEEIPQNGHQTSAYIEELDILIDYNYGYLQLWSDSVLISILICTFSLFLFFSLVYFVYYRAITRRITDLSGHMKHETEERLQLYGTDPNKDEIGDLVNVYNQMANKINSLNDEILQKERLVSQAQYYALQSQIHPHFLYNTLENIDMLVEIGENEKASGMMASFGKILRYNLSRRKEMATLKEEIRHIEDYLKLYAYRMRDDFAWEIQMDPSCNDIMCPYCMMQPVVENCFKHGFRNLERALWIKVSVYEQNGYAWIRVEDNGEGISKEKLQEVTQKLEGELSDQEQNGISQENASEEEARQKETSVGLENVHDRIVLMCKKGSGLWISQGNPGCCVVIAIKI